MLAKEIYEMLVWNLSDTSLKEYLSCAFHRSAGLVEICVCGDVATAKAVSIQLPKAFESSALTITPVPSHVFVLRLLIKLPENPVSVWKEIRQFLEKVLGLNFKLYRPKTYEKVGFDAAFKGLFPDLNADAMDVLLYNPVLLEKEIRERLLAIERMHTMARDQNQIERANEMNVFAARFRALLSLTGDYLLKP